MTSRFKLVHLEASRVILYVRPICRCSNTSYTAKANMNMAIQVCLECRGSKRRILPQYMVPREKDVVVTVVSSYLSSKDNNMEWAEETKISYIWMDSHRLWLTVGNLKQK